jgi:Ala-tRNA(Pro) deacylase
VDFDEVKKYFNAASVAFAAREKAQALTGCVIGAIPPFSFNEQMCAWSNSKCVMIKMA